jgi:hypothetical protein
VVRQGIILLLVECFSFVLLAEQTSSFVPPRLPQYKPGMSREEYKKEIDKALEQHREEQIDRNIEYMNVMGTKAWVHLLRVTEAQWKLIEPKYKKVNDLDWEMWAGAGVDGSDSKVNFHWRRSSEGYGRMRGKTRDQMPEAYRVAEELVELLEDPNSTDEQIRKNTDALQQARENARKALPKARKELATVLTTPRQEAVFLLWGYID